MPIWFVLILCSGLLILPGGFNAYFIYRTKRWQLLALLFLMLLFGFHEQWQVTPTLYLNYGGFVLPFVYFLFVLLHIPAAQQRVSALGILVGAVAAYMGGYTLSSWADAILGTADYLRMAIMVFYAILFADRSMQRLTVFVLGYLLSGLLGYLDGLLSSPVPYASLGVDSDFTALLLGAIISFALPIFTRAIKPHAIKVCYHIRRNHG
ncbi:hypothetical protein LJC20_00770 [Eubacteriales bacterium OttesenSCG-928-M02]|nr:hypothetical protein [Eubacteriales bacterium OttesenSCG-928-M02]